MRYVLIFGPLMTGLRLSGFRCSGPYRSKEEAIANAESEGLTGWRIATLSYTVKQTLEDAVDGEPASERRSWLRAVLPWKRSR